MSASAALVWFRRDLRVRDHAALFHALQAHDRVYCAFIFDRDILDALPNPEDRRVEFLWESVTELDAALRALGGGLIVRYASAREAIPQLVKELAVDTVYANHDYEPAAIARDTAVAQALNRTYGATLRTFKDQVIFEKDEVLTQSGAPFSVFTPYKNAWLRKLTPAHLQPYPLEPLTHRLAARSEAIPTLESMGFRRTNLKALQVRTGESGAQALFKDFLLRMDRYDQARDFPSVKGPSYLSVHLRFGTISIRQLAAAAFTRWKERASNGAAVWLSELIWREFYFQILYHYPHVVQRSFKPAFDRIAWVNDRSLFQRWCDGQTGYPIVDAAMRQLNTTGYMHNRLRMVAASFLTKDLHIDWRWGERYFAEKLLDFDLSANNGGWQWAASSGCDAQPYFRIFNPVSQSEKFDAKGAFIRRYVPELAALADKDIHAPWLASPIVLQSAGVALGRTYPRPCVDHTAAREKTLALYSVVKT